MNYLNYRRGFSLPSTTALMALLALTAAFTLTMVGDDKRLLQVQRNIGDSKQVVEGGFYELLNHRECLPNLPSTPGTVGAIKFKPDSDSLFSSQGMGKGQTKYQAEIEMVRQTPVQESSMSRVQAVVYEAKVKGTSNDGYTSEAAAEIYHIGSVENGRFRPREYGR